MFGGIHQVAAPGAKLLSTIALSLQFSAVLLRVLIFVSHFLSQKQTERDGNRTVQLAEAQVTAQPLTPTSATVLSRTQSVPAAAADTSRWTHLDGIH